jgi:hypothetical protein
MKGSVGSLDRLVIAKDWQARDVSFGLWVVPPGQAWEDPV